MTENDRIADLEEEIRQLRGELGIEPERRMIATLATEFRLTPSQAKILAILYDAGSSWVPATRLDMALPLKDHTSPRVGNTIAVHIYNLRQALGDDAIINATHRGYTLGPSGVTACRRVLAEKGEAA